MPWGATTPLPAGGHRQFRDLGDRAVGSPNSRSPRTKVLLPGGNLGYVVAMKETMPSVHAETLKPRLHCKIERMSPEQLALLDRIVLQIEAEDLADRLGEAFDEDRRQGKLQRIPELVRQSRVGRPYA